MTLLGWTMEQWAVVLAAYQPKGDAPKDWIASKRQWISERYYAPGEERLLVASRLGDVSDSNPPKDWDGAVKIFSYDWGMRSEQ